MNFDLVSRTALFHGCSEDDIKKLLHCLDSTTYKYGKGDAIYWAGTAVTSIGLVLSGSVQIESNDIWGNRSILGVTDPGDIFAEAYACVPNEPLIVSVIANADCEILFLNVEKMFQLCADACPSHNQLIRNLITIGARKNLQLSHRMFHISSKTIRGRLMSFFSEQAAIQGRTKIVIPFDRQQLADYLNLDRSALSKELGKMKKDGLLEYHKNTFDLKIDTE